MRHHWMVKAEQLTALNTRLPNLAVAVRAAVRPRKFELYGIGLPKSGTHSIADMFGPTFRTQHEADSHEMIGAIIDVRDGRLSSDYMLDYLTRRRRRLKVEVDASHFDAHVLEYLVSISARARFVLTLRDPYRWLDSFINHSIAHDAHPQWIAFRDMRFNRPNLTHPPEERALKDRGLYTLDGYLAYWRWHVERCLRIVPEERLLVVRTEDLSARAADVARFAGLPDFTPELQRTHSYRAARRFGILNDLDPDYLHDKVTDVCGGLVEKLCPRLHHPRELRHSLQGDGQCSLP